MHTLNCRGQLLDLTEPKIMGIINTTPDSFHAGSRVSTVEQALRQAEQMLKDGAAILDIGGASTRPGAANVSFEEERQRVVPIVTALQQEFPAVMLSVDTWRAAVAREAFDAGAHILNDVSAGKLDPELWDVPGKFGGAYVLMHMQGTPQTMQRNPEYTDVVTEVLDFLITQVAQLKAKGIHDIVVDPGFGFGKTLEQNYALLRNLAVFEKVLECPVLAGLSRKSMICRLLDISPAEALNGTTALHMAALERGARILRVHDVREAMETIRLWKALEKGL